MPFMRSLPHVALLGLGLSGVLGLAAAQTQAAPATPAAPAAAPKATVSAATARLASSLAIELSGAAKGQILSCPSSLKVSPAAVCLYVKNSSASLRALVRGKLGARALGDWKTPAGSQASSLLVSGSANGPVGAYLLLAPLSATETLLVVDEAQAKAPAAAPRPAAPAGVVRGEPYVLGSDLIGVVSVTPLGGGKYRLSRSGADPLTVTVGQKPAQLGSGTVQLPLVPATDGKNLIFPLAGLRALGCTFTPAGSNVTVACGSASIGLRPIIF